MLINAYFLGEFCKSASTYSTWATASACASKKAFGNLVSVAFYNLMFAFYVNDECSGSTQQQRWKIK